MTDGLLEADVSCQQSFCCNITLEQDVRLSRHFQEQILLFRIQFWSFSFDLFVSFNELSDMSKKGKRAAAQESRNKKYKKNRKALKELFPTAQFVPNVR